MTLVGALEQRSEHALAEAVIQACLSRRLVLPAVERFEAVTGRGVRGRVDGILARAGNEQFMIDEGVALSEGAKAHAA